MSLTLEQTARQFGEVKILFGYDGITGAPAFWVTWQVDARRWVEGVGPSIAEALIDAYAAMDDGVEVA